MEVLIVLLIKAQFLMMLYEYCYELKGQSNLVEGILDGSLIRLLEEILKNAFVLTWFL
jgi:hypothetical protein